MGHVCVWMCVSVCVFMCEDRRVCGELDSETAAAWHYWASLQVAGVAAVLEADVVLAGQAF